jgi:uncharacterized protein YbcI
MPGEPKHPPSPLDPSPERPEVREPTDREVADEICRDMMEIHRSSYGRPAARAQAHILDDTVIVLLDGLQLLPNEALLVDNGQGDVVDRIRSEYQKAIEPTFRAAVERATGRRVIGFSSHVCMEEPRFMTEVFRLEALQPAAA